MDRNVEAPLLQTVQIESSANNIIILQPLVDMAGTSTANNNSIFETLHYHGDQVQDQRQDIIQPQHVYILPGNIQIVRDIPVQTQVNDTPKLQTYGSVSTCGIERSAPKFIDDSILATEDITKNVEANACVAESNSTVVASESCNSSKEKPETSVSTELKQDYKLLSKPLTSLQNFLTISDAMVTTRAVASLPAALVRRRGVVASRRALAPRLRFGPVQGIYRSVPPSTAAALAARAAARREPLFLLRRRDVFTHIDTADEDKANWLSRLPLAGPAGAANVWLQQVGAQLFGVTMRGCGAREPLTLGYSKQYAEDHGLPADQPILDLEAELSAGASQWWCYECSRGTASHLELQKHYRMCHKEADKVMKRRRYKCRLCTKQFARLFTLKRHVAMFCANKKKINPPDPPPVEDTFVEDVNVVNVDDSLRTPSDESLHNFTNLLDISTNLFDTDRMPNLDISTKSDNELNFYGLKDDNGFEFPDFPEAVGEDVKKSKKQVHYLRSSSPISCPYCKQDMLRGKLKQHVRVCKARKLTCVCGRKFLRKENLQKHFNTVHKASTPPSSTPVEEKIVQTTENQYQCQQCRFVFKRRGMLLIHMQNSHAGEGRVPLLVRPRMFPCPRCPKLYQSAAKRHKHVLVHHPDTTYDRTACVLGSLQPGEPSVCALCPRQYATRAKLLQHVRKVHPNTTPPPLRKATSTKTSSK